MTLADAVAAERAPLFEYDFSEQAARIRAEFAGRSVCVIGAGGSIGRAVAELLLMQRPRRTLLVDISENNLTAVTRRLRGCFPQHAPDFEAWPLDFTGQPFKVLLERERPDIILNFAAYKHVRSEKDHLTLAEMLRVNVLGNLDLLAYAAGGDLQRLFVISTDKAANPASCMGATKRLMEQVLFDPPRNGVKRPGVVTTTRFANVLFSDGSLPASFIQRLEQRQPLAGPSDVQRYFITPREAARLCLLAACHPASHQILVPRMRPEDMLDFVSIAERFLHQHGLKMRNFVDDVDAATAWLQTGDITREWPCLFSPSTTSGEKQFEEFVEPGETTADIQPYRECEAIVPNTGAYLPAQAEMVGQLKTSIADHDWLASHTKQDIVALLQQLIPSFEHVETGMNLDQKL